jgi:hypothetical protein
MEWEEALDQALELNGDSAYHPLATVTFGTERYPGFYAVTSLNGQNEGLDAEEVATLLTSLGANDDNWSYE